MSPKSSGSVTSLTSLTDLSSSFSFDEFAAKWGLHMGSDATKLCSQMRSYVQSIVTSPNGEYRYVVWDLHRLGESLQRLLSVVVELSSRQIPVMIVSTDRHVGKLAVKIFEDTPNVVVVHTKWLNGMLSNKETLSKLAKRYRVTPHYELTKATQRRFNRYIAPIESFLLGPKFPGRVFFVNSYDHLTSMKEVYNNGIPLAALCDVESSWVPMVDYPVPCITPANNKQFHLFGANASMKGISKPKAAGDSLIVPSVAVLLMIRFAAQIGLSKFEESQSSVSSPSGSVDEAFDVQGDLNVLKMQQDRFGQVLDGVKSLKQVNKDKAKGKASVKSA